MIDLSQVSPELGLKYQKLCSYIAALGSAAVAYSSGVDSTFLLETAHCVLGDKVIALTARSRSFPSRELEESLAFCREKGIRHIVLDSGELQSDAFRINPPDRCYLCKRELFTKFLAAAEENGIAAVLEGSNTDDTGDYRPGMRAVAELGILSPLREAGLSKAEIRTLSRLLGLPTWKKPSYACLASRFAYGEAITEEKLGMVEKAEDYLMSLGYEQLRVRIHGTMARIELPPERIGDFCDESLRLKVYTALKSFGFSYVSLDLQGYRTGSMNEILKK